MNFSITFDGKTPTLNGKKGVKIGDGAGRNVYRCGRYVVKVLKRSSTEPQNRYEWENYRKIPADKLHYFATVYCRKKIDGFDVLVQRHVKHFPKLITDDHWELVSDIEDSLGLSDVHEDNWRVDKHGNVKIVDIGYEKMRQA